MTPAVRDGKAVSLIQTCRPQSHILTSDRSSYRTSTTLVARSRSKASSNTLPISLTLSTPTRTTFMISPALSGVPPALDSTHSSRCAFRVRESVPVARVASRWLGSMMGCRLYISCAHGRNQGCYIHVAMQNLDRLTLESMQTTRREGCDVSPAAPGLSRQASAICQRHRFCIAHAPV